MFLYNKHTCILGLCQLCRWAMSLPYWNRPIFFLVSYTQTYFKTTFHDNDSYVHDIIVPSEIVSNIKDNTV